MSRDFSGGEWRHNTGVECIHLAYKEIKAAGMVQRSAQPAREIWLLKSKNETDSQNKSITIWTQLIAYASVIWHSTSHNWSNGVSYLILKCTHQRSSTIKIVSRSFLVDQVLYQHRCMQAHTNYHKAFVDLWQWKRWSYALTTQKLQM